MAASAGGMTWRLRYISRLDVIALRLSYPNRAAEHRLAAILQEFDDDGVYRCRVMRIEDVEPYAAAEWERVAGQPASAVD